MNGHGGYRVGCGRPPRSEQTLRRFKKIVGPALDKFDVDAAANLAMKIVENPNSPDSHIAVAGDVLQLFLSKKLANALLKKNK